MSEERGRAYQTIVVLAAALLVIFTFVQFKGWSSFSWEERGAIAKSNWPMLAALFLLVISFISGLVAEKISWTWLKFGELLNKVTSPIILGAIFFIMLTPLAILYRIFTKDNLMIKKKERKTYYTERNHVFTAKDIEKPF